MAILGLSQAQLAEKARVSVPMIRNARKGRPVQLTKLYQVADTLIDLAKNDPRTVRKYGHLQPDDFIRGKTIARDASVPGMLFSQAQEQIESHWKAGKYGNCIELLERFFPEGVQARPSLDKVENQLWVANRLADCYCFSGRADKGLHYREMAIALGEESGGPLDAVDARMKKGHRELRLLGKISDALELLEKCKQEYLKAGKDSEVRAARVVSELLRLSVYQDSDKAEDYLAALDRGLDALEDRRRGYANAFKSLYFILRSDFDTARRSAWDAQELLLPESRTRDRIVGYYHLGNALLSEAWAKVADHQPVSKSDHLDAALFNLTWAHHLCEKSDIADYRSATLVGLAKCHLMRGQPDEAERRAREAVSLASVTFNRYCLVESLLLSARLKIGQRKDKRAGRAAARAELKKALVIAQSSGFGNLQNEAERLRIQADQQNPG